MNDRDKLLEDILDVTVMALQTARSPEARRSVMVIMNYLKTLRTPERRGQMESDNMARAMGGEQ